MQPHEVRRPTLALQIAHGCFCARGFLLLDVLAGLGEMVIHPWAAPRPSDGWASANRERWRLFEGG